MLRMWAQALSGGVGARGRGWGWLGLGWAGLGLARGKYY